MSPKQLGVFTLIKRVLFVAIGVSILHVAASVFLPKKYFFKEESVSAGVGARFSNQARQSVEKDYAGFIRSLRSRSIFTSPFATTKKTASSDERKKLEATIKSLRLVGILDEIPRRVIVENAREGRSFYLREGETFLEGIEVKTIGAGSVTLNCFGQEIDLYL